ncbi:MAG TPA: glucosidase, partial [Chloroflexota bacterium]|nr:glucosidase [Chloroflexota bacterium]
PWEYPWFAAWDLAFHAVTLAYVDPAFAKYQLIAMCREWFMHPNGALAAYEWAFDDVNPPVHAWAAAMVYTIDGRRDRAFLGHVFQKLLLNFTWWVNRKDAEGNNLFGGGFLGLDNIGPFDRSHLPVAGSLEQSDGTAWMAQYCLAMLMMARELAQHDRAYDGLVTKFLEHFAEISAAMTRSGLWDEADGFFYDRLVGATGSGEPMVLRYKSIVGAIPTLATVVVTGELRTGGDVAAFRKRYAAFAERRRGEHAGSFALGQITIAPGGQQVLLSVVSPENLRRLLAELLDEDSLLSPYGLRSLSKRHLEHPFTVRVGDVSATIAYEPAESRSGMFGGNSNWRGPVWFPLNYLVIEALERYHSFLGDAFTVECPTGSGRMLTLQEVAAELRRRLVAIFLPGPDGRRPVYGAVGRYHTDPEWQGLLQFHEYFHGDDGAGLGASHQTGWTGLVAALIAGRPGRRDAAGSGTRAT